MYLHSFQQSIAHHLNDSSNFESSFEVKYIPCGTQLLQKHCTQQSDREALRRFVVEFESLQAYNSSAKSTPKKTLNLKRKDSGIQIDNITAGNNTANSLTLSLAEPQILRDYNSNSWSLDGDYLMDHIDYKSFNNSSAYIRSTMGCKSLTCCETLEDDDEQLLGRNLNSSSDSVFDMQPPLQPSFKVTPPKQNCNATSGIARFLRSSFHVKRAKITDLRRSVSVTDELPSNENPNADVSPKKTIVSRDACEKAKKKIFEDVSPQKRTVTKDACEKAKKKILEDTTNRNSGTSMSTRNFPNKSTSPFRRVLEQSSFRTPRADKYALSSQQHTNPVQRIKISMFGSDNDVFSSTAVRDEAQRQLQQPQRTQSEKMTSKTSRVTSWAISFETMLEDAAGLATFAAFLKMEFSAENIYFWTSCERYRNTASLVERQSEAKSIFNKYIVCGCLEPVNLDAQTRNVSEESLQKAEKDLFVSAQKQIFHLMKFDSYQRFIRSDLYRKCEEAEEKNQALPYGADSLDALLKTNFLQSASPKLKKSASNADDHRRKIMLPWHRKTRSKSRDRIDIASDDNHESSDGSTSALNTLLVPSLKLSLLTSAKSTENGDSQNLRCSLPSSLKSLNANCSLCRVKFSDEATTIVQIRPNETVGQLVERLLEKRGIHYKLYEVIIKSQNKSIDLQLPSQEIAGEEVEIEQRVTFKLYLPDPKVISVKSKPKKYLHEVVKPILQKYNYDADAVDVLRRDTMEKLDLTQLITIADGLRLHVVLKKNAVDLHSAADYQNDNVALNYLKSKELACEFIARNAKNNLKNSSTVSSSASNLDEITNNIFDDIIKEKTRPGSISDQYSLKSDDCGSEISLVYDTLNAKKNSNSISNLRLRGRIPSSSSTHSTETNEINRPIIAKLKAGVKLQVTERMAEKQDELLVSLKTRLDNQSTSSLNLNELSEYPRNRESPNKTALALRQVRSNLSPVNKVSLLTLPTSHCNSEPLPSPLPLERPCHSTTRNSQVTNVDEESDETSAACKEGPPPLPPKPKVLPTKPSNWGANNSD